uniref:FAR1 domain-containing protein n=1 Tax=Oryza barthii TaxID=65489 RepID=A0A0D3GM46_9ORYZ
MATSGSLDEVQEINVHLETVENALVQTVVNEDDFVDEESGSDTDEQATENGLEIMEPKEGMAFASVSDAFVFYERYARKKGFSITRRISSTFQSFTFACRRQDNAQCSSNNAWKHHQKSE